MLLQINDLLYDDATGIILKNNKEYKLTKIQKNLFNYFIANPQKIISKEILMQEVWGRIITENTINKFISTLRSYIEENSAKPKIIVTHFGYGLSFEGNIVQKDDIQISQPNKTVQSDKHINKLLLVTVFSLLMVVIFIAWLRTSVPSVIKSSEINLENTEHVLILPTNFNQIDISRVEQMGLSALLQATFDNADSEGKMVFDQSGLGNREVIEKYWQLDKKLVVLQSKVLKNGDIYEAVIKLSQGSKVLDETKLTANNLNDLLTNQINYMSKYQSSSPINKQVKPNAIDSTFLEAMGYKKLGNIEQAKTLLLQILEKQESFYRARLELAKLYLREKQYDKSLSQLNTLKSTQAYENIATEIELTLAKVQFIQHQYDELIENLKKFQVRHLNISATKKAKIKLQIADAYLALGDIQKSMQFYQQAVIDVQAEFNPNLFARSYYGQGIILAHQSNDDNVFTLFEKSQIYAKLAGNLKLQILALDEMAKMLLVGNQWDKGIALKKQALELMELENDKSEVAQGLGTLAAFLIQSGRFSEAKKVNDRMGDIAEELGLDTLILSYLHYDAVILLNLFKFEEAKLQINKQLELAINVKNYGMQLDNAFLEFEMRLAKKELTGFKQEWDKRTQMIKDLGFDRYQVYMEFYLARYYKQMNDTEKAIAIINKISEKAKFNNDMKILVDAQNQLAEIYTKTDARKALEILNAIEQYKPDANPYLELKALALYKLGHKIEALNILNQAKLVFNEAWKSENQILLEQLQQEVK